MARANERAVSRPVCATIDVEDFYDGMAVLGHAVARAPRSERGLEWLLAALEAQPTSPKVTFFAVGTVAPSVSDVLRGFAAHGHEIASHGADHGRLPESGVVDWLRAGREALEDLVQVPVRGFRSPRFDVPPGSDLARYRDQLAEAGYAYVSDAARLGEGSPVREAPVLNWHGLRLGGGSYQRLLPWPAVAAVTQQGSGPAVLYYHSYDFDGTVPGLGSVRSVALARQLVGRDRISSMFLRLTRRFGSVRCDDIAA